MSTVHIAGAGLAGLACALRLAADAGRNVVIHEAAPQAGGRCRSFRDAALGRTLDNGSHLVLSGNRALLSYLERCGARDRMAEVRPAAFPFLDLRTGESWTLRPGGAWLFDPARRVPGGRALDYLAALKLLAAGRSASVADVLPPGGRLYERLWAPLAISGLNMAPERASARLFASILKETLLRGEAACRPLVARDGLASAFVDPAVRRLEAIGVPVRSNARLEGIETADGRVAALSVAGARMELGPRDALVLALPPAATAKLLPGLPVPPPGPAIVNAHFLLPQPIVLPGESPFLGLVGGTAEWLFLRGDVLSATVSAADRLAELPGEAVAAVLWADAARALGLPPAVPPFRIVKERRATFDQSVGCERTRPSTRTPWTNLFLAGDWTDTGLPATLEGAVRSGERAAAAVLAGGITPFARFGPFPDFTSRRSGHI